MTGVDDLDICDVGHSGGFVLPLGGQSEQAWPPVLRAFLYGLGLCWCFMAVALISDVFMGAIECITAKKTRKFNPATARWHTAEVWNPTVANLTLMALGSSAPEILLALIELFGDELYSGDLGPSTIVGSAAFNLLCIIAVCISAIPNGEYRRIKEMQVYVVTAIFSICAYLWLLVILMAISPNVVEPWEGIVTFLFFPLLVVLAFLADRGYMSKSKPKLGVDKAVAVSAEMTKEELAEADARIRREYAPDLTEDQVSRILLIENSDTKSRAQYRVAATRAITGGKRVQPPDPMKLLQKKFSGPVGEKLRASRVRRNSFEAVKKVTPVDNEVEINIVTEKPKSVLEFAVSRYAVLENAGEVKVCVMRHGNMESTVFVKFKTRDGQAKATEDYIPTEGTLEFGPNEEKKEIAVTIVDDVAYEDDEEFWIDLFDPTSASEMDCAELGETPTAEVVIIDDDMPGVICFPDDTIHVPEEVKDRVVDIVVNRKNGCSGTVTCKYKTEGSGAIAGTDFEDMEGTLTFEHNETTAKLKVKIKARGRYERSEDFRLILSKPTGGAKFCAESDGGADTAILTIFIESEQAAKDRVDRLMSALAVNWDKAKVGHANWAEQFRNALFVNGGDDDDEEEDGPPDPPSIMDWVMHIITLPWKLLFAFVPPTDYCGGWVCFVCSLGMIAIVTALINDVASLFGCVLTMPKEVTAITFVALGTSLPDTFASMAAATQDSYADASVGNVTGSNSVNVFLGLGLPWMIGAIYWRSGEPSQKWKDLYELDTEIPERFRNGAFIVKAGTLSFSVGVFCCCAIICLIVMYIRRQKCFGELGGPTRSKYLSSAGLVFLWLVYIGLSIWKSMSKSTS